MSAMDSIRQVSGASGGAVFERSMPCFEARAGLQVADHTEQKMQALSTKAEESESKVEELTQKVKSLEQENLAKEQEIKSLTHRNQLLETEVEKMEASVKEAKAAAGAGEDHGKQNEALQRRLQLLEDEAEETDKTLRETSEKYAFRSIIQSGESGARNPC
jgi:predicted RNase H-like nuclease (RuvC/YqgF family)